MKVKRRLLAFFFSVLMIWQGFFFAKAEGENSVHIVESELGRTENEESSIEKELNGLVINTEQVEEAESRQSIEEPEELEEEADRSEELGENVLRAKRENPVELHEEPPFFSKELVGEIQKVKDTDGFDHYVLEYVIRFNGKRREESTDESADEKYDYVLEDYLKTDCLRYFDSNTFDLDYEIQNEKKYKPSYRKGTWKQGKYETNPNEKKVFIPSEEGTSWALVEAPDAEEDHYLGYYEDSRQNNKKYFVRSCDNLAPEEGFELRYFVEINELPIEGAVYDNEARIRNPYKSEAIQTSEVSYRVSKEKGSFEEEGVSITLEKTDRESGKHLKGAQFLVSRNNSTYKVEVETNEEGIVKLKNLLPGNYEIRERKAPEGYVLDQTVHEIKKKAFERTSELRFSIPNQSKNSEYMDIVVEKQWLINASVPSPAIYSDASLTGVNFDKYAESEGLEDAEDAADLEKPEEAETGVEDSEGNRELTEAYRELSENTEDTGDGYVIVRHVSEDEYVAPSEGHEEIDFGQEKETRIYPNGWYDGRYYGKLDEANDEESGIFVKPEDDDYYLVTPRERINSGRYYGVLPKPKIYLYRNEEPDPIATETLILDKKNKERGYYTVFKNMPRRDKNGNEIHYSVREEELEDYRYVVTGTADTKFTITNYHNNSTYRPIPVTKIWKGDGPHPKSLTVYLYAKGWKRQKAVLSDANGWQHTFSAPRVDKTKEPIPYTIKEEAVEGYQSVREDLGNGKYNVFTNTKNPTSPNTDNPGGGGGTPPNNPGGGRPPRVIENLPANGTTPPPTTPDAPGEVLGTKRPTLDPKKEPKQILGVDREPEVLGTGRGWTKTFDSGMIQLYFALCLVSAAGFALSLLYKKKSMIRRK